MQTTLLGLATIIILALVAALAGPLFVDWNQYRAEFEARASQLTGLRVRLAGPIEARLLPTPSLTLQRIDISRPGEAGAIQARKLDIEFALGGLMRGEWRAAVARLEGAEFALGLDGEGRLDWPAPLMAIGPDVVSIQRLDIVDSRALLTDAASGASLVLDKLDFRGELRSLAGPVRGEGSFVLAGQHYPYRISASRAGEGGAVRVRLNVDPIDRPLLAEVDAMVSVERGVPRLEGTLNLARPVGRARGGEGGIVEPWRMTTRFNGNSRAVELEQIDFQYGPDERPIKLKGLAMISVGDKPRLEGVLSSTQVDLDRVLALPEPVRQRPVAVMKLLAERLVGANAPLPSFPVKLGISVENVTLAGATLQRMSGDITADDAGFDVEALDFRAPGATQVRLSGRLSAPSGGVAFRGPIRVEARDPRALVAWLGERSDTQAVAAGALRVEGELTLGGETIAIDRLKADLDRMTVDGRLAYFWASGNRPPRIEAVLDAPQLDFDRAHALVRGVLSDIPFEWPREGALAVKVGRASYAGVEASRTDVSMRFDSQGLEIERLAIGDLGGAAFAVKGRIDTSVPRGTITLDLDARALDGVTALMEKFAPQAALELRRNAGRIVPAKLHASLAVNARAAAPAAAAIASFKVNGSAGTFRINLQGEADRAGEALTIESLPRLAASGIDVTGRLDAGDGAALAELLGLDRFVVVDPRPARASLAARGPLDGPLAIDGRIVAGGLDLAANGTVRMSGDQGPTAGLSIKLASANLRTTGTPLPASLTAQLSFAEGAVGLTEISGQVAGTDIGGRLKVGLAQPLDVDGDIVLGALDLPAAMAAAIGVPPAAVDGATAWPSEPFERGALGGAIGKVKVRLGRVVLAPSLAAADMRGALHFDQSTLALEEIDGTLAKGRLTGALTFRRGAEGLTARSTLRVAGAELSELLAGESQQPLSGRLTLDLDLEGTGRSPFALVGSLRGHGMFSVQDGGILRLDPTAFGAVMRSVDQGLPIDAARIGERVELALGGGRLSVPLAQGEIAVADGLARLSNVTVRAEGADLAVNMSVGLAEGVVDARLLLAGPGAGDAAGGRPEIGISLKGALLAPNRTLDVAAFSNWLALRAVERQAKRLDALESGREVPVNPYTSSLPAPRTPTAPAIAPPPPARTPPNVPSAQPQSPPRQQPPVGAPKSRPSAQQPAPVDIRPAPTVRTPSGAGRTEGPSRQAQPPRPVPSDPVPSIGRSLIETLLGR